MQVHNIPYYIKMKYFSFYLKIAIHLLTIILLCLQYLAYENNSTLIMEKKYFVSFTYKDSRWY